MSEELDRIWARLDEQDKRIDRLETPRQQRVDKLHADLGLPYTHDVHGRRLQAAPAPDYATTEPEDACGCPASDELRETLKRIEAIVSEMAPPAGIPGPSQRLLIRVREELGLGWPL